MKSDRGKMRQKQGERNGDLPTDWLSPTATVAAVGPGGSQNPRAPMQVFQVCTDVCKCESSFHTFPGTLVVSGSW